MTGRKRERPEARQVASFSLPVPPSSNNLYVARRDGKGRAKTSEYDAWIREALVHVALARAGGHLPDLPPMKHVRVEWRLPFNYARDVDNTKPLLDLLKRAAIVIDDRWVDDNRQMRVPVDQPLTVTIWQL